MKKLHFEVTIDAPAEKVWHTMLDDEPYRQWTKVFTPDGLSGYYKGNWEKGSKMLFVGQDPKTGKEGGMVSVIAENKPYEFLSIKHIGIVNDGVEDTTSDEAKKWAPAYENYTLTEKDGKTEVQVDQDVDENEAEMFEKMWPKALQTLKALAEK